LVSIIVSNLDSSLSSIDTPNRTILCIVTPVIVHAGKMIKRCYNTACPLVLSSIHLSISLLLVQVFFNIHHIYIIDTVKGDNRICGILI